MHPFEQLIYDRLTAGVMTWDDGECVDVYAVSVLYDTYWTSDEQEREVAVEGVIRFSYNTERAHQEQVARAASPEEARWNPVYWLQNFAADVPRAVEYMTPPPDDELALRDAWCVSLGLSPDGTDPSGRPTYGAPLYEAVRAACIRVVAALHNNGVLMTKLGRPVPVVIHESGPSEANAAATRAANPPGLSREAEEWQLQRTYSQVEAWEALLQERADLSPLEAAGWWTMVLRDFALGRRSSTVLRLEGMRCTQQDVCNLLTSMGPAAVAAALPMAEEYAAQNQENPRGSEAREREGGTTAAARLTLDLLIIIREVGADEAEVARLDALLMRLFQDGLAGKAVNLTLYQVALALHRLRPERYPVPRIRGRENVLINAAAFGLSGAVGDGDL